MYELNWTENDIEDLRDEFLTNVENSFWEFINEEVDTAYYLGLHFDDWFKELNSIEKQVLYSIGARHASDYLSDYQDQLTFWQNKYKNNENIVDLIHMSEYILNNMIFQLEDKELIVNLAFFLGRMTSKTIQMNKEENKVTVPSDFFSVTLVSE